MQGKKKRFSLSSIKKCQRPPPPPIGERPSDLHAMTVLQSEPERELYMTSLKLCTYIYKKYSGEDKEMAKDSIEMLKSWIKNYERKFNGETPEERTRKSTKFLDEEILIHACCAVDIPYWAGTAWTDDWPNLKRDILSFIS